MDFFFLVLTLFLAALTWGLLVLSDRLMRGKP
jgi:hypothetical protein